MPQRLDAETAGGRVTEAAEALRAAPRHARAQCRRRTQRARIATRVAPAPRPRARGRDAAQAARDAGLAASRLPRRTSSGAEPTVHASRHGAGAAPRPSCVGRLRCRRAAKAAAAASWKGGSTMRPPPPPPPRLCSCWPHRRPEKSGCGAARGIAKTQKALATLAVHAGQAGSALPNPLCLRWGRSGSLLAAACALWWRQSQARQNRNGGWRPPAADHGRRPPGPTTAVDRPRRQATAARHGRAPSGAHAGAANRCLRRSIAADRPTAGVGAAAERRP